MERRYDGLLRMVGPGRWPERILVVDCSSYRTPLKSGRRAVRETLHSWYAAILTRRNGSYKVNSELAGRGRQGFWSAVDELATRKVSLWVVCQNAARVWPLLGVWKEIESGTLQVVRDDDTGAEIYAPEMSQVQRGGNDVPRTADTSQVHDLRAPKLGHLVTCSSVSILRGWRTGGRATLTLLDSRNWGCTSPPSTGSGRAGARALAGWLTEVHAALVTHDLGALRTTTASTAYHSWLYCGYTHSVYAHEHEQALSLEQEGYYGGRAEPFWLGTVPAPVWHYDYRSLYAYVCVNSLLPVALRGYWSAVPDEVLDGRIDPSSLLARVTLATDEPGYPYRDGSGVVYPVGVFSAILAGPELADAVAHNRVVAWHEVAAYRMAPALQLWMQKVYNLRCVAEASGQKHLARFAKALLVSLCGRLAQRSHTWTLDPEVWTDVDYGSWYGTNAAGEPCEYMALGGQVVRSEEGGWAVGAVPAMAAWITSAGRMRLLEAIRSAGWENVYYVDTDSVFTTRRGAHLLYKARLVDTGRLGYLEPRAEGVALEIRGVKHYVEGDRVVCAGLPAGANRLSPESSQYTRSESVHEAVHRGDRPEATELLRTYQSRLEGLPDGRLEPIRLPEMAKGKKSGQEA